MNINGSFDDIRREIVYAYENTQYFRKHAERANLTPVDIRTLDDLLRLRQLENPIIEAIIRLEL